jgi:HAD superfamily hydrolase (TIGR01509 family)
LIKSLVFDFDGLILDTEVPDFESWREIFEEHGFTLSREEWCATIGIGEAENTFSPYDRLEAALGMPIDRAAIRIQRRKRYLAMIESQSVLPGVLDYLDAAREHGLSLAIASSGDFGWVGGHLERLGLSHYFDHVRCSDHVSRTKPHPELYLCAVELLGVAPHEAIAFEDSAHGVEAAVTAGLYCVAVPNPMTRDLKLDRAHLKLDSLAALPLPQLLQQIGERAS